LKFNVEKACLLFATAVCAFIAHSQVTAVFHLYHIINIMTI